MEDKPCTGTSSTSGNEDTVQCMREVFNSDWRLSVLMIADHGRTDKMAVHTYCRGSADEIHMCKVRPKRSK